MIKIAIFHNLKQGGGLNQIKEIVSRLSKKGYKIDIYSHQKHSINGVNNNFYYPIKLTHNSIEQSIQAIFELSKTQHSISKNISKKHYDYTFVFPCYIVQSPHILRFLPKKNTYYFFLETKREFYEKTSFDYFTPKRILSRIIRYPIKIFDQINCKSIEHIISNSNFSKNNLIRIYNKNSIVIYPGMKKIRPEKIIIKNNHKFLSLGLLSMLKGHHISAELVPEVEIYGEKSHEDITKYLPKNISIHSKLGEKNKNTIYKNHTFFLANQINESFGLTTLEATNNNCYVFARNEGGTPEIIKNGYNGSLIPIDNIIEAKNIIKKINQKKTITFFKTCIIDWDYTVDQILKTLKT
ncbi:MAG: glycosyltransferase family 4 protein [Candidatus Shapirobacteria bacterium]